MQETLATSKPPISYRTLLLTTFTVQKSVLKNVLNIISAEVLFTVLTRKLALLAMKSGSAAIGNLIDILNGFPTQDTPLCIVWNVQTSVSSTKS